jgi:citrate lyase beta subunit
MSKWKGRSSETPAENLKRVTRRLERARKHGLCGAACREPERVARLTKVVERLRVEVAKATAGAL